jgi:hypothetical protein
MGTIAKMKADSSAGTSRTYDLRSPTREIAAVR